MQQSTTRPHISVCIPTYEMYGVGHTFLRESLEILSNQTFKDFDVVISDYSKNDLVKKVCDEYSRVLNIHYHKNLDPTGGMSANTNNAIRHSNGKITKVLFQDDFLADIDSLKVIAREFDLEKDKWLVTGCLHSKDRLHFNQPHYPVFKKKIHLGGNTLGSPSVLAFKNEDILFFDTNVKMFMDCDYYKRCYDRYGLPKIVNHLNVVIGIGAHQITNAEITAKVRDEEYSYILKKYNEKTTDHDVTIVAVSGVNPRGAIKALRYSIDQMRFKRVLLISHECPENLDKRITWIRCAPDELSNPDPKNTTEYSRFIAYQLDKYIDTGYALIVHNNAFVLRPEKWDDRFFDFDYIGAPWKPEKHYSPDGTNIRVGNGGFSFRSKRMLHILNELDLPFTDNGTGYFNEDGLLCVYYRNILENHGIRFAPPDIAALFSTESECPETVPEPFGFHDNKTAIPRYFFIKYWFRKLKENIRYILRGT